MNLLLKRISANNHQIFIPSGQPYSAMVKGVFSGLQIFGSNQKVSGISLYVSSTSFLDPIVPMFGFVAEEVNCLRSGNILQIKLKDPLLVDRVKELKGCENLEVHIELTGLWKVKDHGHWISWKLVNFKVVEELDDECLFD